MKVKISKENWINATTDFKGKFWCPIERQESLLNVWPNSVDIEIEVDKPNTKKVKKYKYSRKELAEKIYKVLITLFESQARQKVELHEIKLELLSTQPQPIKEDRKECKHKFSSKDCRCFYCGKEITSGTSGNSTPSPLELPKINNNFSSMEQYNWAKQITDEVNKLYQLIKEKL